MTNPQEKVQLSLSTPLGPRALSLKSFNGQETLSGLFSMQLETVSSDQNIAFERIVGQSATVTIKPEGGLPRSINGIVTRIYQGDSYGRSTSYFVELRPWLWLLTLTSDSRIFQGATVPQIIEQLFSDLDFSAYQINLARNYEQRQYTVQYQETAFDFVSRLMEEEGIFYYFEHQAGKHTLILADDPAAHKPSPALSHPLRTLSSTVREAPPSAVTGVTFEQQLTTTGYAVDDFNFETAATDLLASVSRNSGSLSMYEYPGRYQTQVAGAARAQMRLESAELPQTTLKGKAYTAALTAGHTFDLLGHKRATANGRYVLQQVRHQATGTSYSNDFVAFPAATPFRPLPLTPKPVIPGTQTAIVVGPIAEEIYTDEYGRVKVQFHWDRQGQRDENSSSWIRVAQGWANKSRGSFFIPRIGQEVIVTFLNGDPDRPIVTGSVYNSEQRPPYNPTDVKTP